MKTYTFNPEHGEFVFRYNDKEYTLGQFINGEWSESAPINTDSQGLSVYQVPLKEWFIHINERGNAYLKELIHDSSDIITVMIEHEGKRIEGKAWPCLAMYDVYKLQGTGALIIDE